MSMYAQGEDSVACTRVDTRADQYDSDGRQLDSLRLMHKEECKGLIVQIRYLKAKWTRESTMRSDLCNQKRYLLVLLARSERK